jgi:hypothetical protein
MQYSALISQKADDSITDKARKNLVNKLNQQHGKENVVVIKGQFYRCNF